MLKVKLCSGLKKKKNICRSVLARQVDSLPSAQKVIAIKSSSYKAIINMMQIPSSKPKFWQTNVASGSVCKLSLCIKSGSLEKTDDIIFNIIENTSVSQSNLAENFPNEDTP